MKILVVDDHTLIREGLRHVLRGLGGEVEVLEAANGARAFEITQQHPDLDLVLLDYHLPDLNGLQALDVFAQRWPELPIIVLSGSINPHIMRQVLHKGAAAFLTKSSMSDELLSVMRLVLAGNIPAPQLPASSYSPEAIELPSLTPRQQEVLQLLVDGYSNKEIGRQLGLSNETVKNHVSSILRSFGVSTRTQAVAAASLYGYRQSPRLMTASRAPGKRPADATG